LQIKYTKWIRHKLKYRLSSQNLEKLYLVYIRPIFEYACEIWDNCGVCYSTKLEKLQLDAARIVTDYKITGVSYYVFYQRE
jgi:hypothetical protein